MLETSVDSAGRKLTVLKLQYDEMEEEIQSELTDKKKLIRWIRNWKLRSWYWKLQMKN